MKSQEANRCCITADQIITGPNMLRDIAEVLREMKGKYEGRNPQEKLHGGEPYFFLRAQDMCAPAAVTHYANHLQTNGDAKGSEECHAFAKRMREWQAAHPELVKMPD